MKFTITFYFCVIFSLLADLVDLIVADVTPVLLWGIKTTDNLNVGLRTIESSEFANEAIIPLLQTHMLIVYLEDNLKPRDFMCTWPESEKSCYKHLKNVPEKTYYLQIDNPLEFLGPFAATNTLYKNGVLQFPLECIQGRLHVVSFNKTHGLERYEQLQQHDFLMSIMSRRLRSCKVVYLYMASPVKSKSRFKRDNPGTVSTELLSTDIPGTESSRTNVPSGATAEKPPIVLSPGVKIDIINLKNDTQMHFVRDKKFAMAYETMFYSPNLITNSELVNITNTNKYFEVVNLKSAITEDDSLEVTLTLNTSETIQLYLDKIAGYMQAHKIIYRNAEYVPARVGGLISIPDGFSYYCRSLAFVNTKIIAGSKTLRAISFTRMQFQLITKHFKKKKEDGFKVFGTEEDDELHKSTTESLDNTSVQPAVVNSSSPQQGMQNVTREEEEDISLEMFRFDEAWDCDGFLSIGIIMTMSLCLTIAVLVAFAFAKLMDIKAVDRFDNPYISADF